MIINIQKKKFKLRDCEEKYGVGICETLGNVE